MIDVVDWLVSLWCDFRLIVDVGVSGRFLFDLNRLIVFLINYGKLQFYGASVGEFENL